MGNTPRVGFVVSTLADWQPLRDVATFLKLDRVDCRRIVLDRPARKDTSMSVFVRHLETRDFDVVIAAGKLPGSVHHLSVVLAGWTILPVIAVVTDPADLAIGYRESGMLPFLMPATRALRRTTGVDDGLAKFVLRILATKYDDVREGLRNPSSVRD